MSAVAETIELQVMDVTGQKAHRVRRVSTDWTVSELVSDLIAKLGLSRNDPDGNPLEFSPRLEREGRQLNPGEVVGDALRTGDELTLTPAIDAG